MPAFRKMTEQEVGELEKGKKPKGPSQREVIKQQYREYLSSFATGDTVEVTLEEGDNRQTEKNRIARAAEDLGYSLKFSRTRGRIVFQVVSANDTKNES